MWASIRDRKRQKKTSNRSRVEELGDSRETAYEKRENSQDLVLGLPLASKVRKGTSDGSKKNGSSGEGTIKGPEGVNSKYGN